MMSAQRKISWPVGCGLLLLFFCQAAVTEVAAQKRLGPLALIPPQGIAILKVNWSQTRADSELRKIVRADEFERITQLFGVDAREVAEWVVFSDLKPASTTGLGAILRGSFDSQRVVNTVQERGWREESYRARAVYVYPADGTRLSIVAPGLLAFGSKAGIEGVLDVQAAPLKGLARTRPFSTMLADLNNRAFPISFMIGIPEKYQGVADLTYKVATKLMDVAGLGILGLVMDKVGLARALGFAITHNGRAMPVKLLALMQNETSAELVAGALNLMKGLPSIMPSRNRSRQDQEAIEAIESMTVTNRAALLSIQFEMPKSALP